MSRDVAVTELLNVAPAPVKVNAAGKASARTGENIIDASSAPLETSVAFTIIVPKVESLPASSSPLNCILPMRSSSAGEAEFL